MGQYRTIWDNMGQYGTIWDNMRQYGTWDNMGHRIIWDMGQYGT